MEGRRRRRVPFRRRRNDSQLAYTSAVYPVRRNNIFICGCIREFSQRGQS
jgi:hypothetical protein